MHLSSFVFLLSVTSAFALPSTRRATVCNGQAELCNRQYGNVTFVGAHNSYAYSTTTTGSFISQNVDVAAQLNLGVRLLQGETHESNGELHLCSGSCSTFDGGSVLSYLQTVKAWLDENPSEVLTIVLTNPDNLTLSTLWAPAFEQSGIADLAYVPESLPTIEQDWLPLGWLIDNGTPVLIFVDQGQMAASDDGFTVPYLLPETWMIWQTPTTMTNSSFPCSVGSSGGPFPTDQHMSLVNHFLANSTSSTASTTNTMSSIMSNAMGCASINDFRAPNFISVDFVDIGNAIAAANALNGFAS